MPAGIVFGCKFFRVIFANVLDPSLSDSWMSPAQKQDPVVVKPPLSVTPTRWFSGCAQWPLPILPNAKNLMQTRFPVGTPHAPLPNLPTDPTSPILPQSGQHSARRLSEVDRRRPRN